MKASRQGIDWVVVTAKAAYLTPFLKLLYVQESSKENKGDTYFLASEIKVCQSEF